jgi:hypothetical protein
MELKRQMKRIIKWFIPYGIIENRRKKIVRLNNLRLEERRKKQVKITNYFRNLCKDNQDLEIFEIIDYFEKNPFSVFPYNFIKRHYAEEIVVYTDKACDMKYVLHENKRMYFPEEWESESIRNYYNWLLIEQDNDSPHRYEDNEFHVNNGDVIVDIGAAEGIFALTNIEKAKKMYLFECDQNWIKALRKTFEPWKEKIVIVNKYISDYTKGKNITLDDFFKEKEVNFIKADIEGAETKLLKGATSTMAKNDKLQIVLCTYHKENDDQELNEILTENKFKTEFTKRYMIFIDDDALKEPYLRRGIIRAKK